MRASFITLLTPLSLMVCAISQAAPPTQTFHGRGVHRFDAAVCPLQEIGSLKQACNRVAIDDDGSTVEVNPTALTIVFHNERNYSSKQLVGDVLLMGTALTKAGEKVPVAVHVFVKKKGNKFIAKPHSHVVTRASLKQVDLENYILTVDDGTKRVVVLTPDAARKAILDPGLAAKLAEEFVEIRDNLATPTLTDKRAPIADITIAIGLGRLAKDVLRAQLLAGGDQVAPTTASELFGSGNWEIRLTALSSLVPKDVVRRELFLYGIDSVPVLQPIMKDGLEKGQSLVFSMKQGKAAVALDEARASIEGGADDARTFLEQSFIGAILEHKMQLALAAARAH